MLRKELSRKVIFWVKIKFLRERILCYFGNLKGYIKITSYLSPSPVRNQACRRVFYLPWDKIHRRCPVAESKERTRNTWDGRQTPAPFVPPAKVPTLGRSPRISSQNACHTNNIQYFHITFTHQWQNYN